MSNSSLAREFIYTPKMGGQRNHAIDTITPHYVVGYASARNVATYLRDAPDRKANANYIIGKDGEIVLNVEERNRSWCSSSSANDNRAVTIECANYMSAGSGHVYGQLPDATWASLVALCADICRRNGKTRLVYRGSANYSGLATTDMLLTMHKWFASTDCPGPWLSNQFNRLANEVNKALGGASAPTVTAAPATKATTGAGFGGTYRCTVGKLNVRDAPSLAGSVVASYSRGETVVLDDWYTSADGYIWGRYTGASSGKLRYVAVGRATGKVEPDDYLVKVG